MRYWKHPPEPGSFREELALAVETHDEFRQFEYLSTLVAVAHHAAVPSKENFESSLDLVERLQERFFGSGVVEEVKKVADSEQDEFLDLMENTFAVVHGDRLRQSALKEHQQEVPKGVPLIYNPSPRGELLDD